MQEFTPTSHRPLFFRFSWIFLGLFLAIDLGCASVPYHYGNFQAHNENRTSEIEFEYGKPHKVLDGIAWTLGIWDRMLIMNRKVNTHDFSEESKEKLVEYLIENELDDVLVRVNQYDPAGEWRRLRENRRMNPGWRYTYGLVTLAHYTLFPGRVLGGDEYNPFTNTLHINSDVPAIALHEAAYAKDIHARALPGTYAFANEMPFIGLWRHTVGINEILGYAQVTDDWPVERETYRVVYPRMGIYSVAISGSAVNFWDGIILTAAGAAAGHVTGRVALNQRENERKLELEEAEAETEAAIEEMSADATEVDSDAESVQFVKHESSSRRSE